MDDVYLHERFGTVFRSMTYVLVNLTRAITSGEDDDGGAAFHENPLIEKGLLEGVAAPTDRAEGAASSCPLSS